jgi:hypothetical protein
VRFWSAAHEDQLLSGELSKSAHDGIEVLVGKETGDAEKEAGLYACDLLGLPAWFEGRGRREHLRFDPVDLPDPLGDRRGVGEVRIG